MGFGTGSLGRGLLSGRLDERGLGGFAALQEDIPADAGEEEQRGSDLAGLRDGGGSGISLGERITENIGARAIDAADWIPGSKFK